MAQDGQGLYGSRTGGGVLRAASAELVGTAILVFAGTAVAVAAILERPTAGPGYDSLSIALAFGLALVALVGALGHVSGAHFNPAVTLALTATRKFPRALAGPYVVAQLLGAVLGACATWIAYGGPARSMANLAATAPQGDVSDLRAFLVEILVTFVLVFVIMAVATDDRVPSATSLALRPRPADRRARRGVPLRPLRERGGGAGRRGARAVHGPRALPPPRRRPRRGVNRRLHSVSLTSVRRP